MTKDLLTMSACLDNAGVEICFLNHDPTHQIDQQTGGMTIMCAEKDIDVHYDPEVEIDPYFNANDGVLLGYTPTKEVYEGSVKRKLASMDGSNEQKVR